MDLKINTLIVIISVALLNIANSSDIFATSIIALLCNYGCNVNYMSVLEMS